MQAIQNVAIFVKIHDPRCLGIATDLITWLEQRGGTPLVERELARQLGYPTPLSEEEIRDQAELVVVLGGMAP